MNAKTKSIFENLVQSELSSMGDSSLFALSTTVLLALRVDST